MIKRNFTILAAGAAAAVGSNADAANPAKGKKSERRPNVIFILMDDAGYGDFGCYGQTKTETPNIDALAERGVRFTDMYSASPVSAPSRCCLMTGLHSGHAQIRSNDEQTWRGNVWSLNAMERDQALEGQAPMSAGTTTLATVMKSAGYKTAMVGKWGLGSPLSESTPNKMGFDFYYGSMCQRMCQNYYPRFMYRNGEREYLDNPVMDLGDKLDAALKSDIEGKIASLKTLMEGEDVEAIKKATEELAQASHKLAEQLYSQAQGQQPGADAAGAAGAQPGAGAAGGKKADDDVIDADFTESK